MIKVKNGRGYITKLCLDYISDTLSRLDSKITNKLTISEIITNLNSMAFENIEAPLNCCLNFVAKKKIEYSDVLFLLDQNILGINAENIFAHTSYTGLYEINDEIYNDPDKSALCCYYEYIQEYVSVSKRIISDIRDLSEEYISI